MIDTAAVVDSPRKNESPTRRPPTIFDFGGAEVAVAASVTTPPQGVRGHGFSSGRRSQMVIEESGVAGVRLNRTFARARRLGSALSGLSARAQAGQGPRDYLIALSVSAASASTELGRGAEPAFFAATDCPSELVTKPRYDLTSSACAASLNVEQTTA